MKFICSCAAVSAAILLALPSCHHAENHHPAAIASKNNESLMALHDEASKAAESTAVRTSVLTASDQQKLTPDLVVQLLMEGNQNYQHNHLTPKNDTAMMHKTVQGQYPEAFVLACMDSRVPVEEIFDRGIGDLFVGRVAGNIIDADVLGSMEYGCKLAGARLIVVLGHESCGAVKAAIEKEELGNITTLLSKLDPAIQASANVTGEHNAHNDDFVAAVVQNNIRNSIKDIRAKSAVLREMEKKGEIRIVGAYYSLHTGEVKFLD